MKEGKFTRGKGTGAFDAISPLKGLELTIAQFNGLKGIYER